MLSDAIESPAKSNDPDIQYSMIQVYVLFICCNTSVPRGELVCLMIQYYSTVYSINFLFDFFYNMISCLPSSHSGCLVEHQSPEQQLTANRLATQFEIPFYSSLEARLQID